MRVLVTGSSGFIGQHVVAQLQAAGHELLGVDRHAPESIDILDREKLLAAFQSFRPDAVVHLAARADLFEKRDIRGYAANIDGVENVCAAIRATPTVRRAIFTSTQLVCRVGYRPQSDQDYAPDTIYGESKVLTEKIVRREDGGGVTWCITRPTTVWGPGMSPHYQRFLRMLRSGKYFHVGAKPLRKSFGYVRNVAWQYQRLLEVPAEQVHQRMFYVGDYQPLVLQEWANALAAKLHGPRVRTFPLWIARTGGRIGDAVNALGFRRFPFNSFRLRNVLTEYMFDLSPTETVCGTVPYSFDEAAEQTAQWFMALDS